MIRIVRFLTLIFGHKIGGVRGKSSLILPIKENRDDGKPQVYDVSYCGERGRDVGDSKSRLAERERHQSHVWLSWEERRSFSVPFFHCSWVLLLTVALHYHIL